MKLRDKASAGFGAVMDYLAYVAAALIGFVWLTVVVMIVTRFFLNKSMAGGLEITEDALLYITFLGAPWLLKLDGHVRIDIVTNHLRPRVREWVNMTVSVLGAMSCLALTWYGARSALEHLQIGITTPTVLRLPLAPLLAVIPVGSFLMSIQFLRMAHGHWGHLRQSPGKMLN